MIVLFIYFCYCGDIGAEEKRAIFKAVHRISRTHYCVHEAGIQLSKEANPCLLSTLSIDVLNPNKFDTGNRI